MAAELLHTIVEYWSIAVVSFACGALVVAVPCVALGGWLAGTREHRRADPMRSDLSRESSTASPDRPT